MNKVPAKDCENEPLLQFIEEVFGNTKMILIITECRGNADSPLVYMNQYTQSLLGFTNKEMTGRPLADLIDESDIFRLKERFRRNEALNDCHIRTKDHRTISAPITAKVTHSFGRKYGILKTKVEDKPPPATMHNSEDPGQALRVLMSRRNMTVKQLSLLTGISEVTISKLRNGAVKNPQIHTLIAIAEALGVPIEEIWHCSEL